MVLPIVCLTDIDAAETGEDAAKHFVWTMPKELLLSIKYGNNGPSVFNACCGASGRVQWATAADVPDSLRGLLVPMGGGKWEVRPPQPLVDHAQRYMEVLDAASTVSAEVLAAEISSSHTARAVAGAATDAGEAPAGEDMATTAAGSDTGATVAPMTGDMDAAADPDSGDAVPVAVQYDHVAAAQGDAVLNAIMHVAEAQDGDRVGATATLMAKLAQLFRHALAANDVMRHAVTAVAAALPLTLPGTRYQRSEAAWVMAEYSLITKPLWAHERCVLAGQVLIRCVHVGA